MGLLIMNRTKYVTAIKRNKGEKTYYYGNLYAFLVFDTDICSTLIADEDFNLLFGHSKLHRYIK